MYVCLVRGMSLLFNSHTHTHFCLYTHNNNKKTVDETGKNFVCLDDVFTFHPTSNHLNKLDDDDDEEEKDEAKY